MICVERRSFIGIIGAIIVGALMGMYEGLQGFLENYKLTENFEQTLYIDNYKWIDEKLKEREAFEELQGI